MSTQSTVPLPSFVPVRDIHPASWHEERSKGIGGSEAAAMFNAGYGCHRRLVMEKRGVPADFHPSRAQQLLMLSGNKMENIIASYFAEETGLKVRRVQARVSKTHPHARVNMDRQIVAVDPQHLHRITQDRDGFSPLASILLDPGPGYLECKKMNPWDFAKIKREGLVNHDGYALQLQQGLAVTEYKWGIFAILEPVSFELLWFAQLRDDRLCAELLERSEETWDWVMDTTRDLPAQLGEKDARCKSCLWRRTCRGEAFVKASAEWDSATDYVDVTDPALVELANDYVDAEAAADEAKEVADEIKARIRKHMEDTKTPKLRIPDVTRFCLSTSAGRKSWDAKALDGEVTTLRQGTLPLLPDSLSLDEIEAAAKVLAAVLPAIAQRFANCQKQGAGSTSFRRYAV